MGNWYGFSDLMVEWGDSIYEPTRNPLDHTPSFYCKVAGLGCSLGWWPLRFNWSPLWAWLCPEANLINWSCKDIMHGIDFLNLLCQRNCEHLENWKQDGRLKFGSKGFNASRITGGYLGIRPHENSQCLQALVYFSVNHTHTIGFCRTQTIFLVPSTATRKHSESAFGFISIQVKSELCWGKKKEVNMKSAWGS